MNVCVYTISYIYICISYYLFVCFIFLSILILTEEFKLVIMRVREFTGSGRLPPPQLAAGVRRGQEVKPHWRKLAKMLKDPWGGLGGQGAWGFWGFGGIRGLGV